MNRTPYRLKMWTSFGKETRFINLFQDMNAVTGFFIPEKEEDSSTEDTINLLFGTEIITVIQ